MKRLLKWSLILMAGASTLAWGADTAIWSLTDGTTANATDRIPIARSAVANNYITPLEIATYVGTTYGTNCATFLGTPSSANLAACLTDETGSGAAVFATSPSLTTPNLGTPSAVTLTNGTGLPISTGVSGLGAGVATAAANATNSSGGLATQNGAITAGNLLKGSATGVQDTGIAASSLKSFAINSGTTRTMANNQEIYICTGACTFTPEASPTAGDQFCVQNADNVATIITIGATAGVQYETTARTSYKTANTAIASSGAVKDQICYVAISATQWNVFSATGTWN